jgi:hypothetical protein
MKAKSIKGKSAEEIQSALQQCLSDGLKPTLAFVFLTDLHQVDAISAILNEQGILIFGATTSDKFSEQGIEPDGIVVMLLDMNIEHFTIVLKNLERSPVSVYESACELGQAGINAFQHPAFIISVSDYRTPGDDIIRGLIDKAGVNVKVIGGVAGEAVNFTSCVFTNNAKSSKAIISLIVDEDKIDIKGIAVSGWKAVGTEKTITKSNGSWIYTIDNEPAMQVIKKFLGKDIQAAEQSEGLVPLNINYPLQIHRESGIPMMRPTLLWNTEDQSVMLGGLVKEGTKFQFSLPPDLEVINTVIESAKEIKEKELPEADAMLIFSCIGRLTSLGPLSSDELEGLAGIWNAPMAGFFSLGEFGKLDDKPPEMHGTTVSWVALKEK